MSAAVGVALSVDGSGRSAPPPTQPLPFVTPLPAAPDVAFDRLASVVQRVLGVPVALVSLVDREQQVFPGAIGLPEPFATSRSTPLSHSFCQHVVRRAAPLVVTDARVDPLVAENLAIPELGVVAYAGMPVIDINGRVAGSLCAIDTEPRVWSEAELALLADLAAAASAELQLRAAVVDSTRSSRRWRVMSAMAESLSGPTSIEEVAQAVADVSKTWLGAVFGGVTVLDEPGQTLRYVDPGDLAGPLANGPTVPLDSLRPSAVAVASREPLFLATVDDLAAVSPDAAALGRAADGVSFAFLPLQVGPRMLGSVALMWTEQQPFDQDERDQLLGLSRFTAQALERASLLSERRDVARTLQTALLPVLPTIPWLEVAGRYLPAHVADAVGGDWFDAFASATDSDGSEHLTVVVGDVTGHDTAAAAVMGRMQATLRALAVDAPDSPDRLLTRLDRVLARTGVDRMATAVAATITLGPDGPATITWSNAGHLPPLHLPPAGPPEYLERPVDLLLGLQPEFVRRSHDATLEPGSTVLLFTDGVVERRGHGIDEGLDALAYAASAHRDLPLEDLLARIVDAASAGGHDDDVVVFGIRVPVPAVDGPATDSPAADGSG